MQKVKLYSSLQIYLLVLALCILCAAFIFIMSSQPAVKSAEQSGTIAERIAPIFVSGFGKMKKVERIRTLISLDYIIRKTAHFCVYALLGLLIVTASMWHNRTWATHISVSVLWGILYAASDEIHQAFVPGRGPLLSDVLLDSFGVIFGVTFVCVFIAIRRKRKS